MPPSHIYPVQIPAGLAVALMQAANTPPVVGHAEDRKRIRGGTLRPGTDTPLWNELATAVAAQLKGRGAQARLGRRLGLPRQRVHEFLQRRRHLPDAERTLMLLIWLQSRAEGREV